MYVWTGMESRGRGGWMGVVDDPAVRCEHLHHGKMPGTRGGHADEAVDQGCLFTPAQLTAPELDCFTSFTANEKHVFPLAGQALS